MKPWAKHTLGAVAIGIAPYAWAGGIPVIDAAALKAKMGQFLQDAALHAKDTLQRQAERQLLGRLHQDSEERSAAGFGQVVAHEAKIAREVHQAGIEERSRGDRTTCHSQAVGEALSKADRFAEGRLAAQQSVARGAAVSGGFGQPVEAQRAMRSERMKRVEEECREGGGCLAADLLIGGQGTMGAGQMQATERMTGLIIGPNQPLAPVWKAPGVMTQGELTGVVDSYRRMALLSLSHASMSAVAGHYAGEQDEMGNLVGVSRMDALNEFVEARLGSESEWLKSISNADDAAKTDPVMPAEIARQHLVVDTYRTKIELYSLESSLRREMLQAALLAIEVTPL